MIKALQKIKHSLVEKWDAFTDYTERMDKRVFNGVVIGIVLIVFALIMLLHHSRNRVHDLPYILKNGRLTVLTDSSQMGFSVKNGNVCGFQYEIVKAFADSLGVELVISEENDFGKCREAIKNGDYDIIANYIPVTSEWKKDVAFTDPLNMSKQVLVQRIETDSTKSTFKLKHKRIELANDSVYIPLNSPFKMRLEHLSDEIAEPIHIVELKNTSTEQMVRMVSQGKIKYTICDEDVAEQLVLKYPNLDVSLLISFEQQQAWAVHKDAHKLLEQLNGFLHDFIGSSEYWKIYRKYY
ncbi:MAG: hypothetical protein RIS29_142 [Bacteroidota bacterium]|jgi:membrane-bound lytic murein transglycosylase F